MRTVRSIFVYGSNPEGRHGKGAAFDAKNMFGAQYGNGIGLSGDAYAIITKELRNGFPKVNLEFVKMQVDVFLVFAGMHPSWRFNVAEIGCGLAGFYPAQIAPMFFRAPSNVTLPKSFVSILKQGKVSKWRRRYGTRWVG